MKGPLQALLEEERITREKLKEKQRESVKEGYQRRSLPGGRGPSPRVSGARRSMTPPPSSSTRDLHLEKLARPTSSFAQKQAAGAEKRQSIAAAPPAFAPPERELPKTAELTGEKREQWDAFLHRTSVQHQEKEKYLEMLRKKKEAREMQACTFEPELSKASKSIKGQGSMLDRQKEMEARKAQKIKQMRQAQFDKEMSQCSFQPNLSRRAMEERGLTGELNLNRKGWSSSKQDSMEAGSISTLGMRGYNSRQAERNYEESEGSEYWDEEESPIHHVENSEETVEATLLPYGRRYQEEPEVEEASLSATEVSADQSQSQHEDTDNSQFKVLQRLQERQKKQPVASLTSQSPGVQGFAAALRRSSGRLSATDLPTPGFGSVENEAPPRRVSLTHGILARASLREQGDSDPDSIEGFLSRHSAVQPRRASGTARQGFSEASDADSPVLGGARS